MYAKPENVNPERGRRVKQLRNELGMSQDALIDILYPEVKSVQWLSKIENLKSNLIDDKAKLIADRCNEHLGFDRSAGDTRAIRWEWLYAMDDYKTIADYNRALILANAMDAPEVQRADQLTWACDILLHEAMRKLNLAGGGWQLEDMENGSTVPFTSAQQDEMQRRLQEYAGELVAHHFMQARINQTELSCAESRGDITAGRRADSCQAEGTESFPAGLGR